jgi:hypothetical protein
MKQSNMKGTVEGMVGNIEARHAFDSVLKELKTNLNETKNHVKRASDYLEQIDIIMEDAEKLRNMNTTSSPSSVKLPRNVGNSRKR